MSARRIATPADLGALVRESRRAAHLTQAELAAEAGVSREWLLGLERGSRPRAELTKVLAVLDVLDLPLTIGRESSASEDSAEPDSAEPGARLSTAEVTRRAITETRPADSRHVQLFSPYLPRADLSAMLPKFDVTSVLPKVSTAALMPAVDPSVLAALRRGMMPTAGSLVRASLATSASGSAADLESGNDESADSDDDVQHVDDDSGQESRPR